MQSNRVGHYENMNIALRVRTTLLPPASMARSELSTLSTGAPVRERWKQPAGHVCNLLFIGLPSAGKTTLTRQRRG
jgi:hypothetical protein